MSSRAPFRTAALVAATALVLTGCGDDNDASSGGSGGGSSSSGAFPVTVETAFGDVTIEEEPTTPSAS
jgi:iron complex transport system substrate-binding protein